MKMVRERRMELWSMQMENMSLLNLIVNPGLHIKRKQLLPREIFILSLFLSNIKIGNVKFVENLLKMPLEHRVAKNFFVIIVYNLVCWIAILSVLDVVQMRYYWMI